MRYRHLLPILLSALLLISCEKSDDGGSGDSETDKQWVYNTLQRDYLWSSKLPTYANAKNGEDMKVFYESLRYRANRNVGVDEDYYGDRFSYVKTKTGTRAESTYGLGLKLYLYGTQTSADAVVQLVDPNSPAYKAGLRGGEQLTKITNLNSGQSLTFPFNFSKDESVLAAALNASRVSVEYSNASGSGKTATISAATFTVSIIPAVNQLDDDTWYISYAYFPSGADGVVENLAALKSAFTKIKNGGGAKNLIVDLRSNGGGGLMAATQFASFLAPKSKLGQTYCYLQDKSGQYATEKLLTSAEISTLNPDLEKLYFIGDGYSASASELLIHCLKPIFRESGLTCKLAASTGVKTYGKNVGGYTVESTRHNWLINLISMRVYNKNKVSGYEAGIAPDLSIVYSGDVIEEILYDIAPARYADYNPRSRSRAAGALEMEYPEREHTPVGLILGHKFVPEESGE